MHVSFSYGHPRHGKFPGIVYHAIVPAQNALLTPTTQDTAIRIKLRKHYQLAVLSSLSHWVPPCITRGHIPPVLVSFSDSQNALITIRTTVSTWRKHNKHTNKPVRPQYYNATIKMKFLSTLQINITNNLWMCWN
jgi:hypothetical protein